MYLFAVVVVVVVVCCGGGDGERAVVYLDVNFSILVLRGHTSLRSQRIMWDAKFITKVDCMQGKHPTCNTNSPGPNLTIISTFSYSKSSFSHPNYKFIKNKNYFFYFISLMPLIIYVKLTK